MLTKYRGGNYVWCFSIALIGRLLDANIGDRNTKQILLTSTERSISIKYTRKTLDCCAYIYFTPHTLVTIIIRKI